MSGHWTYRQADVHVCDKPPWDHSITAGDIWKCDECKQEWRVDRVDLYRNGMEGILTWSRIPKHDTDIRNSAGSWQERLPGIWKYH